jgi:capsular exopolysaccharide synthesis family protein
MQDLNTQLENLKGSILESLKNIKRNLTMQEENFSQQNSQNKNYLASIPHDERVLQEIKRKQNITEGLYLYLLQKREEAAISGTASGVAHYKQIDMASAIGPVEPNSVNILIYSALFGFFISFSWIYIRQLFNDKVNSKQEVIDRTSLPVIGQINHISKREKHLLYIWGNNAIGEQFRAIRTSVYSMLKDKSKKVILITSSTHAEGKSFVSLNLAAACAMPGKKVALLEFDIRKPTIAIKLNLENTRGLTQYLTGEVNSISEISYSVNKIPSLHVYPSGPLPSNPADLLSTERLDRLFESLKANYDYIIIDSPPSGMVSDSFILGEFSDMVLYIIRSEKTLKKQLDFIRETIDNNSFNNVALVLNDLKRNDSYGFDYKSYYSKNLNGKMLV